MNCFLQILLFFCSSMLSLNCWADYKIGHGPEAFIFKGGLISNAQEYSKKISKQAFKELLQKDFSQEQVLQYLKNVIGAGEFFNQHSPVEKVDTVAVIDYVRSKVDSIVYNPEFVKQKERQHTVGSIKLSLLSLLFLCTAIRIGTWRDQAIKEDLMKLAHMSKELREFCSPNERDELVLPESATAWQGLQFGRYQQACENKSSYRLYQALEIICSVANIGYGVIGMIKVMRALHGRLEKQYQRMCLAQKCLDIHVFRQRNMS